jgi:hypothetical protein
MGLDRELFPSLSHYNTAAGQKLQPAIAILGRRQMRAVTA